MWLAQLNAVLWPNLLSYLRLWSKGLFICAKDLFIEATQVESAERDGGTPIVSGGGEKVVG